MVSTAARGRPSGTSATPYRAAEDHLGESLGAIAKITYQISGIVLDERKRELVKARLYKRLTHLGFTTYAEYVCHVESKSGKAELDVMIDLLTTNKTSFFREHQHFDFLRDQVLPHPSSGGGFKVWCAGCSSGEEPYTLTMVLNDALSPQDLSRARVLATDLSTEILARAREGVYDEAQLLDVPERAVRKYFERTSDLDDARVRYAAKPALRRPIRFAKLNLMGPWPMGGPFDVIMCRNVMIYFDSPTRQRLVSRFSQLLAPGGHLFIGHSESLNAITHDLAYIQPAVYRK